MADYRSGDPRRHRGDRRRHVPGRCRRPRRPHRRGGREPAGQRHAGRRRAAGDARRRRLALPYRAVACRTAAPTRKPSSPAAPPAWPAAPPRVITFSTQFKGHGILEPLAEYRRRAAQAMVDYSFHQIITDPSDEVVLDEIPQVVASGVRSLKVFLTYDPLHLDDRAVPARAGRRAAHRRAGHGALRELRGDQLAHRRADGRRPHRAEIPCVVASEDGGARGDAPRDRAGRTGRPADPGVPRLLPGSGRGNRPRAGARPEGLGRDLPAIFRARRRRHGPAGLRGRQVHVQPQPARRRGQRGAVGDVRRGTLDIVSSDHSGSSYEGEGGKRIHGDNAPFRDIPNGVPGLAARLPIVFSEGVAQGAHRSQHIRAPDRDQSGAAVRAVSAQGHDRAWRGRRHRAVGSEQAGHHHQRR